LRDSIASVNFGGADRLTYDVRRGFASFTDEPRYDMEFVENWLNMGLPECQRGKNFPVTYLAGSVRRRLKGIALR
jgi:hypothetical protein